ncbi:hypothetical protein [Bradyrhizobium sp. SSUT77]|uniref:hypothetical protein n=1 Tax=Bradyrhizobium sp. SSUT77 TaxID=3040603 RepID=UPI00244828FA|nr:hypothetical protein [Bradyrhizobium sp. SSUT77]MDH2348999.1 hypothetical protein [Bradyrhizobium sp. SSUT77]
MSQVQTYLPNAKALALLAELREPLVVYRLATQIGGLSMVALGALGIPSIGLRVLDRSIAPKFEIFELLIEPWIAPGKFQLTEMARIRGWDEIKCLFRFEWLRPAMPGEVPPHCEKVVGDRGPRKMIPSTGTHLAVSMVGIVFSCTNDRSSFAAILNSDDDPATLRLLDRAADAQQATLDCEMVDLNDVEQWIAKLEEQYL